MKSLKDFAAVEIKKSTFRQISGGDGPTTATDLRDGSTQSDTWHDCNGDGTMGDGDQVSTADGNIHQL